MDYYEVLGVSRDADAQEIKQAYRRLARRYHPDVNGGSAEATDRFKQISEAYAVLSDSQKRRRYDAGGVFDFGFDGGLGSIFDIFNQAFGFSDMGRGRWASPGRDLEQQVDIELEEVLTGGERDLAYERAAPCEACKGSGASAGSERVTCPTCGGHGQVRQRQQTILGSMVTVISCPDCGGTGEIIDNPCPDCGGRGVVRTTEQLRVELPPGIGDGQHLEYAGMGDVSADGGPPGNLYVRVNVADHEVFTRHGNHLYMSLDISFAQAALGDTVTVPTLEGNEELQIPAGIQSGEELRLRGQGLPSLRNGRRGDEVISVRVNTPTQLTDRQIELLQELAREEGTELNPPAGSGIFDRVRKAFGGE